MKFGATATALTLAMAAGAQSSLIPLTHHHLAVSAPLHLVSVGHLHHPGSVAVHAATLDLRPKSVAIHASTADLHHGLHHDAVILDPYHGHHQHLAPIAHHAHHEGEYIAKTRGAVHKAPLAGHAASAASINLQPAPGTI